MEKVDDYASLYRLDLMGGEWPRDVIVGLIRRHLEGLRSFGPEIADCEKAIADHEALLAEIGEAP